MTTPPAPLTPQEKQSIKTIENLNQRGGRMLSVVDLVEADSLSLEAAAYLLHRIRRGASFLTAANPGGAGKTAVMGALLALTPPGSVLREIGSSRDLDGPQPPVDSPTWHICHELGAGRIPGYLWGASIPAYLGLIGPGSFIASNLHADTLGEVEQALCGAPNELPRDRLQEVDLIITLVCERLNGDMRRHTGVIYTATGGGHCPVFARDAGSGCLLPDESLLEGLDLAPEFECLTKLVAAGARELRAFRWGLLSCLSG